jgi:predicted hydrocarbon binding protein
MLSKDRETKRFSWEDLGNIEVGRPNLGQYLPVQVYRLLLYTMKDVLIKKFGVEKAVEIFREAGKLAGVHFCKKYLNKNSVLEEFLSDFHKVFIDLKIGDIRVESINNEKFKILLTISEDLDCSGLSVTNEEVCDYDEGFLAGVFQEYTGKEFIVKEIDCWANGGRVCRFEIKYK